LLWQMETMFTMARGLTVGRPVYGVKELSRETLKHKRVEQAEAMSGKTGILSLSPLSVWILNSFWLPRQIR
jgi:hypothetical protein